MIKALHAIQIILNCLACVRTNNANVYTLCLSLFCKQFSLVFFEQNFAHEIFHYSANFDLLLVSLLRIFLPFKYFFLLNAFIYAISLRILDVFHCDVVLCDYPFEKRK